MSLQCCSAQRGWGGGPGPSVPSDSNATFLTDQPWEVDAHLAVGAPLFWEMSSGELGDRIKSPVKG